MQQLLQTAVLALLLSHISQISPHRGLIGAHGNEVLDFADMMMR